jgi:uncharacterized protein YlxW (UPF0749 family)
MDKDTISKYAPMAMVVIGMILQWNLFVTPEKLEIKHRQVLMDVANMYTTKEQHNDLKAEINDMKKKIDKIYEVITTK